MAEEKPKRVPYLAQLKEGQSATDPNLNAQKLALDLLMMMVDAVSAMQTLSTALKDTEEQKYFKEYIGKLETRLDAVIDLLKERPIG